MGGITAAALVASVASMGTAAPEAGSAAASADAGIAAGTAAADTGTAAAVGAGAADVGTAAGLGSGLLAGTSGTALGSGALAANLGASGALGMMGSAGTAGGFAGAFGGGLGAGLGTGATLGAAAAATPAVSSAASAGATGALAGSAGSAGAGMATPGITGVGNAIGSSIGAGAGQVGLGFQGAMNGAAYYGDTGLMGGVANSAAGYNGLMGANMSTALGDAPTGVFSGLLPGGGMTGTGSGALGGGISGAAAGSQGVGDATMGGLANSRLMMGMGQFPRFANGATSAMRLASNAEQPYAAPQAPPVPGGYRRTSAASNGMPIPAPLPSMGNPTQSMIPMPGSNSLPTNSSYGTLLQNMLSNTASNPEAQLLAGQYGSTGIPGYGTNINPGYIIPGMY